jgi:RNA polymerase sigma-70 factor (ECF subfamily)
LLELLAPDAVIGGDRAAVALGTPERIAGQREVATFFNGAAQTALAVFVGERPASAWFLRGEAKVVFDFTVADGQVQGITFRAEPDVLAQVVRRDGANRR